MFTTTEIIALTPKAIKTIFSAIPFINKIKNNRIEKFKNDEYFIRIESNLCQFTIPTYKGKRFPKYKGLFEHSNIHDFMNFIEIMDQRKIGINFRFTITIYLLQNKKTSVYPYTITFYNFGNDYNLNYIKWREKLLKIKSHKEFKQFLEKEMGREKLRKWSKKDESRFIIEHEESLIYEYPNFVETSKQIANDYTLFDILDKE